MGRVVLVTGVSRDLGGRFARVLAADPEVDRVVGVDVVPPRGDLGGVRFLRVDIRNPVISKVIADHDVDTVVHMSVVASPGEAGGRAAMKELNVIGTMQLLAACQQATSLRSLVVRSSTTVYGSTNRDPAMFTEDMAPNRLPKSGYAKDAAEVEGYVRGFARRRPDVAVTTLRAANVIGPRVRSSLTGYFRLPVVPTLLGFDARLQLVHETDLLECLRLATVTGPEGTYNVAGEGILMLSQAVRRLGRPALPLPTFAAGGVGSVVRRSRLADFSPEQMAYLTYGRGVDTTRMRTVLGFVPDYTTESAFADFARAVGPGMLTPERVQHAESAVAAALGGTAPAGTAPAGTAPAGTAPAGTAPGGTAPGGTAPGGSRG